MAYVPEAGDVVWLQFSPQAGHEQAGHRPAVVLSPATYNRIGLMLCCPLTTKLKGYPFEVPLTGFTILTPPDAPKVASSKPSAALADQVKSLDWRVRGAKRKGKVSDKELAEIRAKARALIGK